MTAFGPIPLPQERARVQEVGSVQDMAGRALHVGVNGGAVTIGGHVLSRAQFETFMQLAVRAAWLVEE